MRLTRKSGTGEIVDFAVLEVNEEIENIARQYFAALQIPEKAKIDAFHLAVAAWHKMDYLPRVELQTYCQRARPKNDAGNQRASWSSHADRRAHPKN